MIETIEKVLMYEAVAIELNGERSEKSLHHGTDLGEVTVFANAYISKHGKLISGEIFMDHEDVLIRAYELTKEKIYETSYIDELNEEIKRKMEKKST